MLLLDCQFSPWSHSWKVAGTAGGTHGDSFIETMLHAPSGSDEQAIFLNLHMLSLELRAESKIC